MNPWSSGSCPPEILIFRQINESIDEGRLDFCREQMIDQQVETPIFTQTTSKSTENLNLNKPEQILEVEQEYLIIWTKALAYLEKKLRKPSFETWIRPTLLIEIKNDTASVAVRNEFARNFLVQSYYKEIQDALREVLAQSLAVKFVVVADIDQISNYENANETEKNLNQAELEISSKQISFAEIQTNKLSYKKENSKLVSKFNFFNFVLGKSNQAPFTFAKAITETGTGIYNSLFIYSETGLGKTHLLHAIGNQSQELNQNARIKYVKAEEFTNELIISIQRNNTAQFRSKYRSLDLLLFDDFHFLDNKKTCQEEFSHTFESIVENGGKIVISSNKGIDEFKSISNKLKSKIRSSLVSQIDKPSFSTRMQILSDKALSNQMHLNERHLGFIANKFENNVRELEGALLQVSAYKNFAGEDVDDDLIANLFGGMTPEPEYKGLSVEKISKAVGKYFSIDLSDIMGKSRQKDIALARHICIYLAHNMLRLTYSRIGEYFSGRKHSSIIHSISIIRKEINSDNSHIGYAINKIKESLANCS